MDIEQLEAAMIMAKLEGHEQKIYILQRLINLKTKPHLVNKNPLTMSVVTFESLRRALETNYQNICNEQARARGSDRQQGCLEASLFSVREQLCSATAKV